MKHSKHFPWKVPNHVHNHNIFLICWPFLSNNPVQPFQSLLGDWLPKTHCLVGLARYLERSVVLQVSEEAGVSERNVQVTVHWQLPASQQPAAEAAGRQHRQDGTSGRHPHPTGDRGEGQRAGHPGTATTALRGLAAVPRSRPAPAGQRRRRQRAGRVWLLRHPPLCRTRVRSTTILPSLAN